MVGMGFTTEDIKDALLNQKYNEVTATYLLLGLKTEVRQTHTRILTLRHTLQSRCTSPFQLLYSDMCPWLCSQDGAESRVSGSMTLPRVRQSPITNGTNKHSSTAAAASSSSSSSSSHSKTQRSASTYHRQRRHSDFCKRHAHDPSNQNPLLT